MNVHPGQQAISKPFNQQSDQYVLFDTDLEDLLIRLIQIILMACKHWKRQEWLGVNKCRSHAGSLIISS
ncbi:hypothetical protein [Brevibacillus laterosporus]|nr:hypothetical protein [Brevibacillus laterosporus]MDN9011543.1 hypothetical protein [Brevibacillus laterosporus]MDO0942824.1 hypothetical protein [Brevibacillus laterosporus]